jgi:Rad3-related DNA helicase
MLTKLVPGRSAILTATKVLQDQYAELDPELLDIRGAGNYECIAARDTFRLEFLGRRVVGCDEGPCRVGSSCELRKDGCYYFDALHAAQQADALKTSYAYWISFHRFGEGLGDCKLLVLDEAHDAAEQLADQLTIELSRYELGQPFPDVMTHGSWRAWAKQLLPETRQRAETDGRVRERLRHKGLAESLALIANLPDDWVWELQAGRVRFAPVVVAPFAEAALFRNIPKIVLMSATLTRPMMARLGIDSYDWIELPSPFPISRRPIYIYRDRALPLRMDYRTKKKTPEIIDEWLYQIEDFLEKRKDRKGIIFCVSYKLQELLLQRLRKTIGQRLIAPRRADELAGAVLNFKRAYYGDAAILLSPSIATGFNFPYQEAEFAVIAKMPFPDTRSPLMQARLAADKGYRNELTMRTLVQACGRIMRATDDQGEVAIFDEHAIWFLKYNRALAANWFLKAVRIVEQLPPPPPSLAVQQRRLKHG